MVLTEGKVCSNLTAELRSQHNACNQGRLSGGSDLGDRYFKQNGDSAIVKTFTVPKVQGLGTVVEK